MEESVAIIGAGVSGLTCSVLFAERGFRTVILAEETGHQTTSAAAAAIWFPYDTEPMEKVIPWAIETYHALLGLARDPGSGVSMIELRQCSRVGEIQIPGWARSLGAAPSASGPSFASAFAITVPLMDTTIYLDYLATRFLNAGGEIRTGIHFRDLEDVDPEFDLVINCAGIGARELVSDVELEPHRGQVVIVPEIDHLSYAIACDTPPLMYAIPRRNDCVFGGTNDVSDDRTVDPISTACIIGDCTRTLNLPKPKVLAERVGLRPFRKSGIRLEPGRLMNGRPIIHNYGHGGAGFTVSWGCAREVVDLAARCDYSIDKRSL
ncbi:MAG: FAD-dependent oxidoreductase [Chthoniobacterales bacterium]